MPQLEAADADTGPGLHVEVDFDSEQTAAHGPVWA